MKDKPEQDISLNLRFLTSIGYTNFENKTGNNNKIINFVIFIITSFIFIGTVANVSFNSVSNFSFVLLFLNCIKTIINEFSKALKINEDASQLTISPPDAKFAILYSALSLIVSVLILLYAFRNDVMCSLQLSNLYILFVVLYYSFGYVMDVTDLISKMYGAKAEKIFERKSQKNS